MLYSHCSPYPQEISDRREAIIAGDSGPTNEESEFKSDAEDVADNESMVRTRLKNIKSVQQYVANFEKIPDFWLTIFSKTELLSDMIQQYDETTSSSLPTW